MLRNTLICFVIVLCFYACNRAEKQQTEKASIASDSLKNIEPKEDTLSAVQNPDSVVYSKFNNSIIKEEYKDSLFTKFSDLSTDDKFILTVPKGNINHTTSVLKIFNNGGELLYETSFTTRYMANGYELENIKNDAEMVKYILTKAKQILEKDSFMYITNEIKKDGVLGQSKEEFTDYDTFIECENDKRPLFIISLGEEDTTYIGYSKKQKKAVDLISCC